MTTPFIAEIKLFGFTYAPRNYAQCNGQLLSISQNTALFSLVGTTYGGNGTTNFALPDLRGRVPISRGQGPGTSNYTQGQQTGVETVTLLTTQLPAHTHQFFGSTAPATRRPVVGGTFADDQVADVDYLAPNNAPSSNYVTLNAASLAPQGGNQPHSNLQPYLVSLYCIALFGIFPSRN